MPELSAALMAALNFTPADLVENHAGRLSETQKLRIRRGWRRTLWIVIALVIAVGLGATILLFQAQQSGSSILMLIGILLTVLNAVIVGRAAQSYLRTHSDLNGGRVAQLSGEVSHTIRVSGRVATYILKIEGQEVIVPKPVFFAVEDRKPYRLYRAPASRTLLAAEPI